jgi:hypothetical protein
MAADEETMCWLRARDVAVSGTSSPFICDGFLAANLTNKAQRLEATHSRAA